MIDTTADKKGWLREYLSAVIESCPPLMALVGGVLQRSDEARLDRVASHFQANRFNQDETLVAQNERFSRMFLLVDGKAEAHQAVLGGLDGGLSAPQKVNEFDPPDVVGEVAMFNGGKRIATVLASSAVCALSVDMQGLEALSREEPSLLAALLRWSSIDAVNKFRRTKGQKEIAPIAATHSPPSIKPANGQPANVIVSLLRQLGTFQRIDGELAHVAPLFELLRVQRDTPIADDGGDRLFLLCKGTAAVDDASGLGSGPLTAGRKPAVSVLFGELPFLLPGYPGGALHATTACELLSLSAARVPELIALSPEFAFYLHVMILGAVSHKLAAASAERARLGALEAGDFDHWFLRAG